jgi:hypothetical protein
VLKVSLARRLQNRKSQQGFLDRQAQQVQTLEQSIVGSFKMEIDYNEASRRTDFLEGMIKELLK